MADLTPPENFQTPGVKADGSVTFEMKMSVCVDRQNKVWTSHCFVSEADGLLATQLSGGGCRHIAHAFLTEAVRREAFVIILMAMSQSQDVIQGYMEMKPEQRREFEKRMADKVEQNLAAVVPKISVGSVREVLEMITKQVDQEGSPNGTKG